MGKNLRPDKSDTCKRAGVQSGVMGFCDVCTGGVFYHTAFVFADTDSLCLIEISLEIGTKHLLILVIINIYYISYHKSTSMSSLKLVRGIHGPINQPLHLTFPCTSR